MAGLLLSFSACSNPLSSRQFQAIYGNDDRIERAAITDPVILERARSTVGIVPHTLLSPMADGSYSYTPRTTRPQGAPPFCPGERFAEQPQLPLCTGTLIAPDLVLTAAHCLGFPQLCDPRTGCRHGNQVCPQATFVFDWAVDSANGSVPSSFQENQVARCSEILAAERDAMRGLDWVLIRLDRLMLDRAPVPLATAEEMPLLGDSVYQISHPMGWPQKFLGGAQVIPGELPHTLYSNTDTYVGSSGGPLFASSHHKLVAILRGGTRDFENVFEEDLMCTRSRVCTAERCQGETYMPISLIRSQLVPYLEGPTQIQASSFRSARKR
jgi:hypothetical protein